MEEREEFPFEEFIQILADASDLKKALKTIITQIKDKNIYWIYSIFSTIIELMRNKNQQPQVKCRCLQVAFIILSTSQYPVVTIFEVYFLPVLQKIALYSMKKTQAQLAFYFQQIWNIQDSSKIKKHSVEYVQRAIQLIELCYKIKPYRTIENQQLKQPSLFSQIRSALSAKGIEAKTFKWHAQEVFKDCRQLFQQKLRRFSEQSQPWMQFLLVNLIQEIKSGKKQLLQLRLLLPYGQSYITSTIINVCQDQLVDLSQEFQHKRKFLGVINQLIRFGDIQAIIMVKNSQFLPFICSRISKLNGHLGVSEGEKLFPQIQASKKDKKQFYCDFLRCLQNWAISMPNDYDSNQFNLKTIYKFLKEQKKFKFPQNLHLTRYQKQLKQNMLKNQERNTKLIQILENLNESKQLSISLKQTQKNQFNQANSPNLNLKLKQIERQLNNLTSGQQNVESSMKTLIAFKDNWIIFLQEIDVERIDENQLETFINQGQKYVEKIQMIVPIEISYRKGKITYREFKNKILESANFHQEVSQKMLSQNMMSQNMLSQNNFQKSNTKHEFSNMKSTVTGRRNKMLRQRMKSKSKVSGISCMSKVNRSKALDRSQLSRSIDKSRLERSKLNYEVIKSLNMIQANQIVKITQRKGSIKHQNSNLTIKETNSLKHQDNISHKKSPVNSKHDHVLSDLIQDQQIDLQPNEPNATPLSKKSSQSLHKMKNQTSKNSQSEIHRVQNKAYKESIVKRVSDYDNRQYDSKDQQFKSQVSKMSESNNDDRKILKQQRSSEKMVRLERSRESIRRSHKNNKQTIIESHNDYNNNNKQDKKNSSLKNEFIQQIKNIQQTQSYYQYRNQPTKNQKDISNSSKVKQPSDAFKKKTSDKQIYQKQVKDFDDYNSISSIHSIQEKKAFQNSAQLVLNITKKESHITKKESHITKKESHITKNKIEPSVNIKEKISNNYHQPQQINSFQYKKQSSSQDIIDSPDVKPLRHSFHDKEQNVDTYKNAEKVPLFKDVFKNNNSIYCRQKQQKLLLKDQGIKNIIKSSKSLSQNKKQSIVNKLFTYDEKGSSNNNMKSIQKGLDSRQSDQYYTTSNKSNKEFKNVYYESLVQSQKDKEIHLLRQRIRQLEKDSLFMRTKLAVKDNQIQSMRNISSNGSERNFQFTSPNFSHMGKTEKSQKSSLRGSSVSKVVAMTPFQKQIESNFKQYLQKIKGTTFKKSLLKLKCLISKTDQIQMGCLSQRGQRLLQSTIFITPQHFDFVDIILTMQHDNNLKIKLHPTTIKKIQAKKQHKINLTIQVKNIPFSLPELQITYKSSSEYASSYNTITLPLSFNKFCQIFPINLQEISQRHILFIRSDDFKMNLKVSKLEKIHECFANFTTIPPNKQRNCWLVIGKCKFGRSIFNICLSLSQKNSWIEGFLMDGQPTQMNFWICTIKEILDVKTK